MRHAVLIALCLASIAAGEWVDNSWHGMTFWAAFLLSCGPGFAIGAESIRWWRGD